jgi:hypothetical protein
VIIKLGWCCWVSFGVKSFRNAFEAVFASGSFRNRRSFPSNRSASASRFCRWQRPQP